MDEQSLPQLAYLGPKGTYSHQAAYQRFGRNVNYIEKATIRDVYDSVSNETPYGLLPQENAIFGSVIESYDILRLPEAGTTTFIRGEVTLAVQHCLTVRKGVKAESIKRILSHEQALGQCADYISKNFPEATLQKVASTAAAAQSLLEENDEALESAAICSPLCTDVFDGLEILQENIQDVNTNFTRFYVLANSLEVKPPCLPGAPHFRRALVRLRLLPTGITPPETEPDTELTQPSLLPSPSHNRPLHLVLSTLLTTFGVPVIRVDRRPSLNPVPFEDNYFIELEELGSPRDPGSKYNEALLDDAWLTRIQAGIERVAAADGEATLLGVW